MLIIGELSLAIFEGAEVRIGAFKPSELLGDLIPLECLPEKISHLQPKQWKNNTDFKFGSITLGFRPSLLEFRSTSTPIRLQTTPIRIQPHAHRMVKGICVESSNRSAPQCNWGCAFQDLGTEHASSPPRRWTLRRAIHHVGIISSRAGLALRDLTDLRLELPLAWKEALVTV